MNPLLALETRILEPKLTDVRGLRVLDAGCGTGRWMTSLAARGASVFGFDLNPQPGCAVADLAHIPFPDKHFDLAICSFVLSYVAAPEMAVAELSRVAHKVIISDMHPEAIRRGWKRPFVTKCFTGNILLQNQFSEFICDWRLEAPFGEPERPIFQAAGREDKFDSVSDIPAVLITSWTKLSN